MTDPLPIREGIIPDFDTERELLDYYQKELRVFREQHGVPPTRIVIALVGENKDGDLQTRTNSWDVKEERSRAENCAFAALLFLHRALGL